MMQQQPDTPGIQSLITGGILSLLASAGVVFAWSKWYRPPSAPASASQYIRGAVNRLGSEASSGKSPYTVAAGLGSHGLSSHKGSIALLAAIVLMIAVLLTVNKRARPIAVALAAAAAAGMLAVGITALIAASNSMNGWNHLASGNDTFFGVAAASASHSISTHSFFPSFGASVGGLVALIGCVFMGFGAIRSSLTRSRRPSAAHAYPPRDPATAALAPRSPANLPHPALARWCRSCNREQPADAEFCGFCGVALTSPSGARGSA